MGVASVLDTCEAFAVTTARQPGRPIRALFFSDGTVVPRREPSTDPGAAERLGSRTATGPHQHQYPYRTEDSGRRGIVMSSTRLRKRIDARRRRRQHHRGAERRVRRLVEDEPSRPADTRGEVGARPGRMPPLWSADGQGRTVRQRHGHHQPQSSPPQTGQRDDDVDRRSVAAMSSATVAPVT